MQISAANSSLLYSLHQATLKPETSLGKPAEQTVKNTNNSRSVGNSKPGNAHNQSQSHELSEDEQRQVQKLQDRDREVRAHEAAHLAAAGGLATSSASFSYQTGPDGRAYAVGGEVSIDTSPVSNDPQATIQKAKAIRAAALAPAQPSGADQAVAAAASKLEASARMELAAERTEEQQGEGEDRTIQDKSTEAIEEATERSTDQPSQPGISTSDLSIEVSHYQDTINPSAPADLLGQLLNTSA